MRLPHWADNSESGYYRELTFIAELVQDGQRIAMQTASFLPTKHLSLVDPVVKANLRAEKDLLLIELSSQSLARLVEVALDGADVVFSDNYFDLPAGRTITVSCPTPVGWTLDQARTALKIRSVFDSYA